MGDRKVVNQYIPPDFDPKLIPKGKKLSAKDGTVPVRMMLPFSMQCSSCNEFLYQGRKFNSKKENVTGEHGKYLGIQRYRFYIKCSGCARHISFLTDPKNADYEMESGATRNYEHNKEKKQQQEEVEQQKEEEETIDPMKALENRVVESQREMADQNNLEEIKSMNARHAKLNDPTVVLENIYKSGSQNQGDGADVPLTEEDEALIKSLQFGKQQTQSSTHRLDEKDEVNLEEQRRREVEHLERQQAQLLQQQLVSQKKKHVLPILKRVKRKATEVASAESNAEEKKSKPNEESQSSSNGLAGLLGGYGSDSDSD